MNKSLAHVSDHVVWTDTKPRATNRFTLTPLTIARGSEYSERRARAADTSRQASVIGDMCVSCRVSFVQH